MTTGNDKITDEFKDMPNKGELYNKEAFDKLIKEANAALDLGSQEQITAELNAVISRHEETMKLSPVLPAPLLPHRAALMGGFRPGEMIVLASPHPAPLMDRLYYSLDRSKHREPSTILVSETPKKIYEFTESLIDPKYVPPISELPSMTELANYFSANGRPSPECKSNIAQHLHIQIWYTKKGKKNPFRDLNVYARMYDDINNPMPSAEGWVIDENFDPDYVPPKDLKDKSIKHLKRTIRQLDKRLQHPNQKYVRLHYIYMRSLTVSALKMKKEVK